MINYVLDYDICALFILTVFAFSFFMRKRFVSKLSKVFNTIVVMIMVMIVMDLLGVLVLERRAELPLFLSYTVLELYQICQHLSVMVFTYYCILLTTDEVRKIRFRVKVHLIMIPGFVCVLTILSTQLTGAVLYFDEKLNYCHGPWMVAMYIIGIVYLAFDVFLILKAGRRLPLSKKVSAIFFITLGLAGVLFQAKNPEYLTTGFGATLGILCIFLSQMNPNDLIDSRTMLPNRRALSVKLDGLISEDRFFNAIAVAVSEDKLLRDGENLQKFDEIKERFAGYLRNLSGKDSVYVSDRSTFVILITDCRTNPDKLIEEIKARASRGFVGGELVEVVFSTASFPSDAARTRKFLDVLDIGIEYASEKGNGTVVNARDYADIQDIRIAQLELKQKYLLAESEQAKREKEAAEKAEQSKSMFLAQMSHEIRTPMTAILGMTNIIERDTKEADTREHARALQNSGNALLTIINDILDYSKIEAGKFDIVPEDYYFASSIYNTIGMIVVRAAEKNLEIFADIDPAIPAVMNGDEIRIRQILMNILTNAIKYTEKGSVTLKATWEKQGEDTALLCVSVTDTGIGIQEENLPKLFNDFNRFDNVKNKGIEGTGLGLAIVKQLLKLMNGSIDVKSIYGQGSTFSFTLPQRIVDASASVKLDNPDKYKLLAFIENERDRICIERNANLLGVATEFAFSLSALEEMYQSKEFTHVIISADCYENISEKEDSITNDPRLIVLAPDGYYDRSRRTLRLLTKPVYCHKMATLLGDDVKEVKQAEKTTDSFVAPEARLLIVDDNGVNLEICSGLLRNHRMNIDFADSGDKCLNLSEKSKYDLIFLDHMMPGKDGIETLKLIRSNEKNPNRETPVIAFTANAVSGMKELFRSNGFDGFLSKPIDIEKMDKIILQHLPDSYVEFVENYDEETGNAAENAMLPGMDMEKALVNCGGSVEMLDKLFDIILSDGKKKLPVIREYVKSEDYENYIIEIHSLKTTAANIGMTELSEKAKSLELAGRDGKYDIINENNEEVMELYEKLLADIEALRASKTTGDEGLNKQKLVIADYDGYIFGKYSLNEGLILLKSLIREYETDLADKIIDDICMRDQSEEVKGVIDELKTKLSMFDYEGAISILDEIIS